MFSWRRIIACLLIVIFAPATVLAAGSLKLCFGADGHRAIETVISPHHHGQPNFAVIHSDDSATATTNAASNADCHDVGLVDTAQRLTSASWKGCDRKPSKSFSTVLPGSPLILPDIAFCDSAHAGNAEAGLITRDPHLASLATIVLLI